MVHGLRLCTPNAERPGLIPGQGTRSHMLQRRVCMPQWKIPQAAAETWHSQVKKHKQMKNRQLRPCWECSYSRRTQTEDDTRKMRGWTRLRPSLETGCITKSPRYPPAGKAQGNPQEANESHQLVGSETRNKAPASPNLQRGCRGNKRERSAAGDAHQKSQHGPSTFYLEGQTCPHNPTYPELSSRFQHGCPATDARSAVWSKEAEWTWFLGIRAHRISVMNKP